MCFFLKKYWPFKNVLEFIGESIAIYIIMHMRRRSVKNEVIFRLRTVNNISFLFLFSFGNNFSYLQRE